MPGEPTMGSGHLIDSLTPSPSSPLASLFLICIFMFSADMPLKLFLDIPDLFSRLCANLAVREVTLEHWGEKVAVLIKG